jgi:membrane protein
MAVQSVLPQTCSARSRRGPGNTFAKQMKRPATQKSGSSLGCIMVAFWALLKEAFWKWQDDQAGRLAASLAYYTLMSLAPLVVLAIAIAGLMFGQKAVEGQIVGQIKSLVGQSGAVVIQEIIRRAHQPRAGILAGTLGFLFLLVGASGVFSELKDALNMVWGVPQATGGGVRGFLKRRLLPFAMTVGVGFLLLISLVLNAVLDASVKYLNSLLPVAPWLLRMANFVLSFAVITLLFAIIYDILPDVKIPWSDVWIGAATTSLLFTMGKTLIGFYLGTASVGSAYGAAGSLIVFLVWLYYSSQILYFGAEFTRIYSQRRGSAARAQAKLKDAA